MFYFKEKVSDKIYPKVFKFKKAFLKMILTAIPLIYFLPADFFDSGRSICLSIFLLNMECPGCGMTRAIMHLIHGDFESAYTFNRLSFIVLPLVILLYIKIFAFYFFNKKILKRL